MARTLRHVAVQDEEAELGRWHASGLGAYEDQRQPEGREVTN
jgi:hypothetical protein